MERTALSEKTYPKSWAGFLDALARRGALDHDLLTTHEREAHDKHRDPLEDEPVRCLRPNGNVF